jgi:hypothetical protein
VDEQGQFRIGFEGSTTIARKDWGLTWNFALEGGGVLVGEKVALEIEASAVRALDRSSRRLVEMQRGRG